MATLEHPVEHPNGTPTMHVSSCTHHMHTTHSPIVHTHKQLSNPMLACVPCACTCTSKLLADLIEEELVGLNHTRSMAGEKLIRARACTSGCYRHTMRLPTGILQTHAKVCSRSTDPFGQVDGTVAVAVNHVVQHLDLKVCNLHGHHGRVRMRMCTAVVTVGTSMR